MRDFILESWFVLIGIAISLLYIFFPKPFLMFAFIFIAQPLFIAAIFLVVREVIRDLKAREVL